MSIRVAEDLNAGKLNNAQKCGTIESNGPATVVATSMSDDSNAILAFIKRSTGANVLSDNDTQRTAENSGYTGNNATLTFSGQTLNNLPVVPGSVVLDDATNHKILKDTNRDGTLYLVATGQVAGKINYFTGAMTLSYPTGQAPNGQINANYISQASALVKRGVKNFQIKNASPSDPVDIYVAGDNKNGARVKTEIASSWM